MQNFHPALVHFPIALVLAAFLFELAGLLRPGLALRRAAGWCLVLGAGLGVLTFASGLLAEWKLEPIPAGANEILEVHEALGWVILGGLAALAVWRLLIGLPGRQGPWAWVFVALLAGVMVATLFSGHLGGRMVYEFGVGGDARPPEGVVAAPAEED